MSSCKNTKIHCVTNANPTSRLYKQYVLLVFTSWKVILVRYQISVWYLIPQSVLLIPIPSFDLIQNVTLPFKIRDLTQLLHSRALGVIYKQILLTRSEPVTHSYLAIVYVKK